MKRLGVLALAKPSNGGTYQYTLSMLEALRSVEGYLVTVYASSADGGFADFGFPVRYFTRPRWRQLGEVLAKVGTIPIPESFIDEDILLAPIYSTSLLSTSKPFAFTLHDLQEHYYPRNFSLIQHVWRNWINKSLLRVSSKIICESSYVRDDIMRIFGVDPVKISVIAAPPLRPTAPEADTLKSVRDRLRLPDVFAFYPAQFWPHKNHLELVKAFRIVADAAPDLGLVLTGKKRADYAQVMAAVSDAKLSDRVTHLGYVSQADLATIYKLAAVLVMPSLFESISLPIYEAFHAGTPVAASNVVGIPEQVGDAGLLFDPKSAPAIAAAIIKIVGSRQVREELVAKALERISMLTSARYAAQIQQVLDSIAGNLTM